MGVFIGGEEDLYRKLEALWSTWTAGRPYMWPANQPCQASSISGITDHLHRPLLTRV
jgi:hypothetical protein